MATLTGKTVGGYLIQEEIGRGGMGVVFKAQQLSMDRTVAIKFLPQKLAEDPKIVARFLREARAAGKLSHHNIVSVHDAGVADGLHYIAMELVEGTSCYKRIKMLGSYTEKEALSIGGQMAEALRYAHSQNILHRDVKPDNFLVDLSGRVRLADLGLARFVGKDAGDSELTQDGTTMGTPYYMSPEQCKGIDVDMRSDIYSLGASMYMLACGTPPYREAKALGAGAVLARVLTEAPIPMLQHNPKLTPAFVALVEKMMHKDPNKRFANAEEMIKAIELCKIGKYNAQPVTSARNTARQQRISNFKQMMIGAACGVLFLIVLGVVAKKNKNTSATPNDVPKQAPTVTSSTATGEKVETKKDPTPPPTNPPPPAVAQTSTEKKIDPPSVKASPPTPTLPAVTAEQREAEAATEFETAAAARREKNLALARELANDLIVKFAETKFVKSHLKEITNLTLP
jgi:serine/threonine protein kinase